MVNSLDSVKGLFEHLQPGCNGIIEDFPIPRRNLKNAFEFMLEDDWNFSIFEDIMRQSELERYEGSTSTDAESDDTPTDVESDDTPTDVDSHDEL